jgi:hypothetical protein
VYSSGLIFQHRDTKRKGAVLVSTTPIFSSLDLDLCSNFLAYRTGPGFDSGGTMQQRSRCVKGTHASKKNFVSWDFFGGAKICTTVTVPDFSPFPTPPNAVRADILGTPAVSSSDFEPCKLNGVVGTL